MAKKIKQKNTITPSITVSPLGVSYSELYNGDCFILRSKLWVKVDSRDQEAICLSDGEIVYSMCGIIVIPVDVEMKWTIKK
jgi:hypothetical protein